MHLIVVALTMLILPVLSIATQASVGKLPALIGKWFLFWAAGVRLAIAGGRQIVAPQLTLQGIFGVDEPRAWPLAQELGFWNLSVGLLCMASLWQRGWRVPLALASGAFYAMAGIKHVLSAERSFEANTAMVSDLGAAVILLGWAIYSLRGA